MKDTKLPHKKLPTVKGWLEQNPEKESWYFTLYFSLPLNFEKVLWPKTEALNLIDESQTVLFLSIFAKVGPALLSISVGAELVMFFV